jgi:hypothetical protein
VKTIVPIVALSLVVGGCTSLPPVESSALIQRVKMAYTNCQTFADSGSVREVDTLLGMKSRGHYSIEFIRGRCFRLELRTTRSVGIGNLSLIYFWDGRSWSSYDSAWLERKHDAVTTNLTHYDLIGPGIADTCGLFPDIELLLGVIDPGFYDFTSATTTSGWLYGRRVYCLSLIRIDADGTFESKHEFWIDPQKYVILMDRYHHALKFGGDVNTTSRQTVHSPKLDSLPLDTLIDFRPPESRPNKSLQPTATVPPVLTRP